MKNIAQHIENAVLAHVRNQNVFDLPGYHEAYKFLTPGYKTAQRILTCVYLEMQNILNETGTPQ